MDEEVRLLIEGLIGSKTVFSSMARIYRNDPVGAEKYIREIGEQLETVRLGRLLDEDLACRIEKFCADE